MEETLGALDTAVRQGKALYAGISSYSAERTTQAAGILRELGTPLLIHQPSYSMLNRWIERGCSTPSATRASAASSSRPRPGHAHRPLSGRHPARFAGEPRGSLSPDLLSGQALEKIRALDAIARDRGQTLAQMALAWTLRDSRVTSTLVGASSIAQLEANVGALDNRDFSTHELAEIEGHATDSGINLWSGSSDE
jgi:L-glyceraldehyde 3-phosphate reductase